VKKYIRLLADFHLELVISYSRISKNHLQQNRCKWLVQAYAMRVAGGPKTMATCLRASHYKIRKIEKALSKLSFFYLPYFALLQLSRTFPARIELTTDA